MSSGPVLPLYLNYEETLVLAEAIALLLRLSEHMVAPDTEVLATEVIRWKEGDAAVARLDQVLARGRERLPILRSLETALVELGYSLERSPD